MSAGWLILWCPVALVIWRFLLRARARQAVGSVSSAQWGKIETFFAAAVAGVFCLQLATINETPSPITSEGVRAGLEIYIVMSGLLLAFLVYRRISISRAFGLVPARPMAVIGVAAAALVATLPFVLLCQQAASALGAPPSESDPMVQYLRGPISWTEKVMALVLAAVVAPFTEELFFRGFLYGVARKYAGPLFAALATALLFGAIHHNLSALPALCVLALGFTLAYELTGSLWTPILMHAGFNSLSALLILWPSA